MFEFKEGGVGRGRLLAAPRPCSTHTDKRIDSRQSIIVHYDDLKLRVSMKFKSTSHHIVVVALRSSVVEKFVAT